MLLSTAAAACPSGNLLLHRAARSSRGTEHPERLTDGLSAREGDPADAGAATKMKGLRPYVEWDLGETLRLAAASVQVDNNDTYRLTVSTDGVAYTPLWDVEPVSDSGLRQRARRDLAGDARYVRLEAMSGDQAYAAAEVAVYCEVPSVWPPSRVVRDPSKPAPGEVGDQQAQSSKLVFGLLAFPLLFLFYPRLAARGKKRLAWGAIAAGALAWTHFGHFIAGTPLHYWDMFHYFMGSKYFPETGYFDLYRCGAKAEREAGNDAELDRKTIRDLETNELYPGDWTRTADGRCRATFSEPRWAAFKADIQAFHGVFIGHTVSDAFSDHGFNATPPNAAWLHAWTRGVAASRGRLLALAELDSVALAAAVLAVYWGFGPLAAAIAALSLGIGSFWSYHWVGGGLGRHVWLAWCTAGFALLARQRYFGAGLALTVAGLLRLFPFGFVGGVGIWILVRALRERRVDISGRRFLAGAAIAFFVGNAATVAAVGAPAYGAFAKVFERHSHTPASNQLGLWTLLSWTAGEPNEKIVDTRLTEPTESWTHHQLQRRAERRPIWALATAAAVGVVVLSAAAGMSATECAAVSGLVLFCLLPMTSYDYTWLVVLVALAERRPKTLPALLAFAVFSQALQIFASDEVLPEQHLVGSVLCLALLVWVADLRGLVSPLLAKS